MIDKSNFIHTSSFVDEGAVLGLHNKIWHFSHLMPNCRIGNNCNIGQNVFIANDVVIGNNVKIQNNVSLYTGLTCGDDVFIGPSVVFTNVINPRSAVERKNEYRPTRIKNGASIGANATIVCGCIIGEFAMIGAGTVVVKDVPAYAIMVGNPAKQQGWMSEFGAKLVFDDYGKAFCAESAQVYQLQNGEVKRIKNEE
jgi:UDP-2-acetamido-3-amino-2,3-dideoxy-glucuronate N-acetyltransferase